jgi:hypothetical protein
MRTAVFVVNLLKVASGILAVQDNSTPITRERALAYAQAATAAARARQVDVWELIGIARNESEFKASKLGPDGKDCGITQTRVTITKYSCAELRRNYWLGFAEGAREMAEYAAACRGKPDYDRCRLNHYNSGVRYAKHGWAGDYYLRVLCFAEAARLGGDGSTCTHTHSRAEIAMRAAPRPLYAGTFGHGHVPGVETASLSRRVWPVSLLR